MKKYSKLLAMAIAVVFLITSYGFAADLTFEEVMTNTRREYSEYITKAAELLKADGVEADSDKASIFLMSEITDFEGDDIDHSQVFVYLPETDSEDFYSVGFYSETKKHSGTAKNFDLGGRLMDLYSPEVKKIAESIESPEEIVNMRLGGRLSFLVYHIEAEDDDYVILYDKLNDTGANYNEMGMDEFEIEKGKVYTETEFLNIIHKEAAAYKEYINEKEDREVIYVDKDGDEKVKKSNEERDDDEDDREGKLCTCNACPDPECINNPGECKCNMADCTSEKCREEAKKQGEKKKDQIDKESNNDKDNLCSCNSCPDPECINNPEQCKCNMADCTLKACRKNAAKEEKRNSKIKVVNEYGVFQGNEKGELNADEYITRAEFAVVVCKMLGIEPSESGESDELDFDDVDEGHWAKEYIKAARKLGIIAGRGGNRFDPDAKISYEEAMKILVATLGYSPMAEQRGGYPNGYTTVAENLGVPTDLTFEQKDEALRGDVMEMVYNSLDVPMLLQKVFGDKAEYTVADGTNGEKMTIRIILELKNDK